MASELERAVAGITLRAEVEAEELEPVDRVAFYAALIREANARLDAAVPAARQAGATWAAIADAAGVARQNAHRRWAAPETS